MESARRQIMHIVILVLGFLFPQVVYHYSVFPLEVTTTQKCHRYVRCLLKNAIRYLKNVIVKLDVCSKMLLDIVIFTSYSLTMLYDKYKPILTMISVAPLVRSNQANNFTGKYERCWDQVGPTLYFTVVR